MIYFLFVFLLKNSFLSYKVYKYSLYSFQRSEEQKPLLNTCLCVYFKTIRFICIRVYAILYPAHFHVTANKTLKMLFFNGTLFLWVYPNLLTCYATTKFFSFFFSSVDITMMTILAHNFLFDFLVISSRQIISEIIKLKNFLKIINIYYQIESRKVMQMNTSSNIGCNTIQLFFYFKLHFFIVCEKKFIMCTYFFFCGLFTHIVCLLSHFAITILVTATKFQKLICIKYSYVKGINHLSYLLQICFQVYCFYSLLFNFAYGVYFCIKKFKFLQ